VSSRRQWPDRPLKTDGSEAPIAIPRELTLLLSESVHRFGGEWMVPRTPDSTRGDPRVIGRTIRHDLPVACVETGAASSNPGHITNHILG
jgi:hypothetical protein